MINTSHLSYELALADWLRVREIIAGEDAVKAAGERYLPRIQSQTDDEYNLYRQRASFFNATARTAEGYLGLIFRRPPFIKLPETKLERFVEDADLHGTSFPAYAKTIASEVLTVGRAGSLVDFESDTENRSYVTWYHAEQIINWRAERINGRTVPTLIALREKGRSFVESPAPGSFPGDPNPFADSFVDQIRVLKLIPSDLLGSIDSLAARDPASPIKADSSHSYIAEIWQEIHAKRRRDKPEWALVATYVPRRLGVTLPLIPFIFHGPHHSRPDIDKSPLQDLIAVNLDHYRLDADYKHGLHYTALPTAWVSGFERSSTLKIGSSTAWVTELPGASAGFLEFRGHGLTSFERAMDRAERLMAVLGSRLLEAQKKVGETAQAIELRQSGENSILTSIATSLSDSLTQVLRWVFWWSSTADSPGTITDNQALVRLNSDFSSKGLSSDELQAIVDAWRKGAISQNTMLELFRKGEILPDGRTNEEEVGLIAANQPQSSAPTEAPNDNSNGHHDPTPTLDSRL